MLYAAPSLYASEQLFVLLSAAVIWFDVLLSVAMSVPREKCGGKFMNNGFFNKMICDIKAVLTSMIAALVFHTA